jgi:hypothetical protein
VLNSKRKEIMIKKMHALKALYFCGFVLSVSMLCGQDQDNDIDKHVPVGTRAMSESEHIAQQELRSKLSNLSVKEQSQLIEEDKEAAKEVSQAEESDEPVTQHDLFYTSHPGAFHRVYNIGMFGDSIEFEDGSVWSVYYRDAHKTLNWLPSDLIIVTPNRSWFSSYGFRLTNQDTGISVEANLTLGPIYNAPFTHWIVGIDYYNNSIYLEDGTIWHMSYFDESTTKKWVVNDTVIIGINDGWLSYSNPNILINVNMLNYASGIVAN